MYPIIVAALIYRTVRDCFHWKDIIKTSFTADKVAGKNIQSRWRGCGISSLFSSLFPPFSVCVTTAVGRLLQLHCSSLSAVFSLSLEDTHTIHTVEIHFIIKTKPVFEHFYIFRKKQTLKCSRRIKKKTKNLKTCKQVSECVCLQRMDHTKDSHNRMVTNATTYYFQFLSLKSC